MIEVAAWYLVLTLMALPSHPPGSDATLVGPVTQAECEQAKVAVGPFPTVISVNCKRAVGMRVVGVGAVGYAVPVFEEDLSALTSR